MRIRTDGDYAYRKDVIEDAADFWGVNKTDAIVKSCDLAGRLVPQLEAALQEADIRPSEVEKFAEKVSTRNVEVRYGERDVKIQLDHGGKSRHTE